jgi:hypothetical protein
VESTATRFEGSPENDLTTALSLHFTKHSQLFFSIVSQERFTEKSKPFNN